MKSSLIKILVCLFTGVLTVSILYGLSDTLTHKRNSFYRYFTTHPVSYNKSIDLKYNSYYFAGTSNDYVYLSNLTAPLHLLKINLATIDTNHYTIKIDDKNPLKFSNSTRVSIFNPHFFITDGIEPRILRGTIGEWSAKRIMYDSMYFNDAKPIGSKSFVLRSISSKTNENILGKESNTKPHVILNDQLLKKQVDGIFCTDGILRYNKNLSKIIYLYHYRNEYLVIDTTLTLLNKGHTIDTNTVAKIKVASITSNQTKTISEPPIVVNKNADAYNNYLFVHSGLMSKNESKKTFQETSVIDIYNILSNTYEFSIYIYPYKKQKLKRFIVTNKYLLGIHNQYLVVYDLNPKWFKDLNTKPKENKDILSR
ncbi:hypothetical protein KFZ70_09140 [Tamlana fucoidanivorans]|uniref:Uncharacterized protein n=1 Tax=Allotamlana fucoidanivorans TaxID=2583814 RepID=A0A5C4SR90_9FLAO|nr:hypothetical protein [Tamlana fucoidanivorans]TNJ46079.1 hypothetical protein FGF67_03545 [Tamlana fucoidanivorans]